MNSQDLHQVVTLNDEPNKEKKFPLHKFTKNRWLHRIGKLSPQLKILLPVFVLGLFVIPLTLRSVSKPTETNSRASQGSILGSGTQYFVSPTGTVNTTCDASQPCNSLEAALNIPNLGEAVGDTIIFMDGEYTGQQRIVNKHFTNPVTIQAANPYKAILQNNGVVLTMRNAYNLHIKDFEMKQVEPVPVCDTGTNSAYIIQLSDSTDPNGPFGSKRGPDNVYYDANGKLYPNGTDYSGEIIIENNIIHDSFCEDHIKLQNGGNINIIGNMFYNQATRNNAAGTIYNGGTPEEFIDANSVFNVNISHNIFFNQFTQPAEPGAFIVVKDSSLGVPNDNSRFGLIDQNGDVATPHPNNNTYSVNPSTTSPGTRTNTCNPAGSNCDTIVGSNTVTIDSNIFFNFSNTKKEFPFLQFGAEDTLAYVLNHGLVQNNLFVGNSNSITRAVFELEGVRNFTFRNNTITGNLPSKHFGYRLKTQDSSRKFPNTLVTLANNIWSDQTGTMGTEDSAIPLFASADSTTITNQRQLKRNVFWNAGLPIPNVLNFLAQFTEDSEPILTDPGIPNPAGLITPTWNGSEFRSVVSGGSNHTNIRSVFITLVEQYGTPTSSIADAADAGLAPSTDILSRQRGTKPDIGAVEVQPDPVPTPIPTPVVPTPIPTPIPTVLPTPVPSPSSPPSATPPAISDLKFNFQPADADVPGGYIADIGERFGRRNGQNYGWSYDIQSATRKRNSGESQLRDTLIHMQLDGNYRWDLAVPNGTYEVSIMAGDPNFTDSLNSLRVEDTVLEDDGRDNFDYYTTTVTVTDGKLTIRTAQSADNAKLNYIIVTSK